MNIKYLLSSLVILLSVSFSASATWWEANSSSSEDCVTHGQVFLSWESVVSSASCFNGKTVYNQPYVLYNCKASQRTGYESFINCSYNHSGQKTYAAVRLTNKYSEPPVPFCSKDSTQLQMREFESSCLADGGSPTIICNDQVNPPDFRMSCDVPPPKPDPDECTPDSPDWLTCKDDEPEPDECTSDSPDWPSCKGDEPDQCDSSSPDWVDSVGKCCNESNNWCDEPVTDDSCTMFSPNWETCKGDLDIDPPSGDDLQDPDKPTGGGTGTNPDNPDNPDSDNSNLASAIGAVKESVDLNTTTIVESSNHIKDAIDRQGEALTESGNINNQLLGSLNNLVNDGFGDLNGQLEGIGNSIDGLGKGIDDLADDLNGAVSENGCTSFSCEGNAATCYLARKAWEEGCQDTDTTQLAEAGDSLISGLSEFNDKFRDGDGNFKGVYNDENIESLIKSYDKSNGLSFDGECPQPKRYDAGLFNFTIDLSPFCEMALIIRACLMAAAAFASYMMIAKHL